MRRDCFYTTGYGIFGHEGTRTRKKWNEDGIERLREKNEARAINNVDEAMLEYCRVFAKQIKPLPPEPKLSDFYHPSEA